MRRRTRWWALWALAIVLVLYPRIALAEPFFEIERNWADYENNENVYGYVAVDCPSAYQASLLLIGEYSSLIQIDTETYNKLMSSSTGGKFYELVQEWGAIGPAEGSSQRLYPSWAGDTYYQIGLVGVYGYKRVWAAEVTDTLKASAREDFLAILNGQTVGPGTGGGTGGSGEVNNDGWYEFTAYGTYQPLDDSQYQNVKSCTPTVSSSGVGSPNFGSYQPNLYWAQGLEIKVWVDPKTMDSIRARCTSYGFDLDDAYVKWCRSNQTAYCIVANGEFELVMSGNRYHVKNNGSSTIRYFTYKRTADLGYYNNKYVALIYNASIDVNTTVSAGTKDSTNLSPWYVSDENGSGGNTPDPGPDPEPEPTGPEAPDPTAPSPPELPEPGDPVIPDPPDPVGGGENTTITNITITNVTNPTGTTPADYTPWLEAILNELKGLHSDLGSAFNELWSVLDEHCVHLQDKIAEVGNYIGDCLGDVSSTITSACTTINDYLQSLFQSLFQFLQSQSQWLVDNLKFVNNVTVDEYDDTSVLYWLRRIYARLGSGIVNTKPTDPVTQWDPWGEWLQQLVEFILGVLTGGIGGVIGNVVNAIGNLSSVFPFCIPFDLLLLMDAITTDPVTPYVSVVMPATDWYDTFTISVDCDVYDDAMEVVRSFELLAFVVYVMLHSKELFGWNASEFSKFWGSGGNT